MSKKFKISQLKLLGFFPLEIIIKSLNLKMNTTHKIKKPKNNSLIFIEKKINTKFFNKLKYKKELLN